MAIKTNSKKAHENITRFIMEWCADEIEEANEWNAETGDPKRTNPADPVSVCGFILDDFVTRWGHEIKRHGAQKAFIEWAQGLPLNLFTFWGYAVSPKKELGDILEETEEERERFSEDEAAELLTKLILRECERHTKRVIF